uniref:Uncharacterized protein n=1 Tax=Physcomitrium patens TaxID=3218 RepID=A0A2K1IXK5_PHYPA|nr:hypothetical protein PHYPA_023828 [Physcomitrium patens]
MWVRKGGCLSVNQSMHFNLIHPPRVVIESGRDSDLGILKHRCSVCRLAVMASVMEASDHSLFAVCYESPKLLVGAIDLFCIFMERLIDWAG